MSRIQQRTKRVLGSLVRRSADEPAFHIGPELLHDVENAVERAVVLCRRPQIEVEDLPDVIQGFSPKVSPPREDGQTFDRAIPLELALEGPERRITRWEHEQVVEAVQERLDKNPEAMRTRRETVEHPFGTLKMRMGATHFLCKTLPKVATEMALCVLGYNMTRVLNIVGIKSLLAAIAA